MGPALFAVSIDVLPIVWVMHVYGYCCRIYIRWATIEADKSLNKRCTEKKCLFWKYGKWPSVHSMQIGLSC